MRSAVSSVLAASALSDESRNSDCAFRFANPGNACTLALANIDEGEWRIVRGAAA